MTVIPNVRLSWRGEALYVGQFLIGRTPRTASGSWRVVLYSGGPARWNPEEYTDVDAARATLVEVAKRALGLVE